MKHSHSSTVLIVDDEPAGRETAEAILAGEGYQIVHAANGREALNVAAKILPDLVLLDLMMPELDGIETCRRLRANPLLKEMPVVMATALDDRESRLHAFEAGADDFVTKPLDRYELRARVRTITRLNRYRRFLAERLRLSWVLERSIDGYVIVDDLDHVQYANPAARRLLGCPADGKPVPETFLALARARFRCEPPSAWQHWPELRRDAAAPLQLVGTGSAPTLRVETLDFPSGTGSNRLIRLFELAESHPADPPLAT